MASCLECNVKMGYSETNASRNHDGLCIACYVKSLVKTKINAANNTKKPTNARFSATENSGLLTLGSPLEAGFAELKTGLLEQSNVNVTDELTAMLTAQQQFNGSARLMQANSDIVEKLTR